MESTEEPVMVVEGASSVTPHGTAAACSLPALSSAGRELTAVLGHRKGQLLEELSLVMVPTSSAKLFGLKTSYTSSFLYCSSHKIAAAILKSTGEKPSSVLGQNCDLV